MNRFLARFSWKMIKEWKKEILLVLLGIVICSCVVIKFTDGLTNFRKYYYDSKGTKEERIFYENRVHFSFDDTDQLEQVVEKLQNQDGIRMVVLKGDLELSTGKRFAVASYSSLPVFSVNDRAIGTVPEHLEDGTIVLSFAVLDGLTAEQNLAAASGETIELQGDAGKKNQYKSFYSCDEDFMLEGNPYHIVAENFYFSENLLSRNDFMTLSKSKNFHDLEVIYIYEDGFTEAKKKEIADWVGREKAYTDTYEETIENTLGVSDFLNMMGSLAIGVVLALFNMLFIYRSVLSRRLPSYSVLKILGVKNRTLLTMVLGEMIVIFLISFGIGTLLFLCYCKVSGEMIYNLRYSLGYSFVFLLVVYAFLAVIMTVRLIAGQPFEAYVEQR